MSASLLDDRNSAVLFRDEWEQRLDQAAMDGYAEGRDDQREEDAAERRDLLSSLRLLTFICERMDAELYDERPTEDEYQAALAVARAAIAATTGERT